MSVQIEPHHAQNNQPVLIQMVPIPASVLVATLDMVAYVKVKLARITVLHLAPKLIRTLNIPQISMSVWRE